MLGKAIATSPNEAKRTDAMTWLSEKSFTESASLLAAPPPQ
jgi:hypothetical protein